MSEILVLHTGSGSGEQTVALLGRSVTIRRIGCDGDLDRVRSEIRAHDGRVAAIALEDLPFQLQLAHRHGPYDTGVALAAEARRTPVVDGSGVRSLLERWAVSQLEQSHPGLVRHKRVLMVPGLNHPGLSGSIARWAADVQYADPAVFFGLPRLPGVGSMWSLGPVARTTLHLLRRAGSLRPAPESVKRIRRMTRSVFRWADVVAGEIDLIRELAPSKLARKTVIVERASAEDLEDLTRRGTRLVATLLPSLASDDPLARHPAAVVEAALAACRVGATGLNEDTYLDLLSEMDWSPAVRALQPDDEGRRRFAFVIHPLDVSFIHKHPAFRWTRYLPDFFVERVAARMPPRYVSKIAGACSPVDGARVEGHLISLGATPRQMMRRPPEFTYARLRQAARMAEGLGARIMGLGAFTSVVGDAGVTVARESPIAITSGNSLTVAATLEAAKQAAIKMGSRDLTRGRAMVIGATGSIGSVCARMIALAVRDVVLVSIEPEKLMALKRLILDETPGARVTVATRSQGLVPACDLVITATSGFGQRILDISECKPGAIICDVARPPDISEAEAALRPDVLVIESGEVLIPGDVDFGYDIGLPPKVAYACLAETALLAMEGRFESYTLGRELKIDRVKEIYRLFKHHGFELAGLRSLGRYLSEEELASKRRAADALRQDVALFQETRAAVSRRLAELPAMSKGVRAGGGVSGGLAALALKFGGRK